MQSRRTLRWLGSVALTGVALGLIAAAPASASSIVYIGADGNVNLVSPDGSVTHRVTSDATADSRYRSPSQTDAGRVVAIRNAGSSDSFALFLDRQTGQVTDNWLLPAQSGPLSFSPFSGGQVSPGGGLVVYDSFYGPGVGGGGSIDVGFVSGPGATSPCTINCHSGFSEPRWIPGTPYAGFIETPSGDRVFAQESTGPQAWLGLADPGSGDIDSFDVSRQNRTLLEVSPDGAPPEGSSEQSALWVLTNSGTPGAAGTVARDCYFPDFARTPARPRWSPDGTMIAWEGAEGVYTSPTPTTTGDGVCDLQPKLVAPGGTRPDWGPVDVPSAGGGGGAGGTGGTGGGSGGTGGETGGESAASIGLAGKQSLRKIAKKGKLPVEVTCAAACDATITALADKRTAKRYRTGKKLGKGSGSSEAAGTFKVTVKLSKKARRGLKKAKKAKLKLKGEIAEAGGAPESTTETVTLRR